MINQLGAANSPEAAILVAKYITKKPTPSIANPKMNFNGELGSKFLRPNQTQRAAKKGAKMITEVGKKAKSRLFDYKETETTIKSKTLHQMKKEAEEVKEKLKQKAREAVVKERKEQQVSNAERKAMTADLKAEKNLRKEMHSAMKSMVQIQQIAL